MASDLPYFRFRFRIFDQSFAFIAMQLSIFGFSRNYSPGFFGGTRGIDLPFVSYLSSPFGSDLSLKRTFRPILALLPFRDGGLKWRFDQLIASAINCSSHCAPCFPFGMVGSNGLGPSTSRLSGVCSNQLSYEPMCGGGNRVRTDDPLLAGQVLYQLSYTPVPSQNFCRFCENKCSLFPGSMLFIKNE